MSEPLFNVNVPIPIKWGEPKPLTREMFVAALKEMQEVAERHRRCPTPHIFYVSPKEFDEYVALGICDRQGRWL